MALKTGVFGDATTPSGRFGQYLWASPAQCLDYSTVHTQTPYQNESKLLWDTIHAFPDLHIHGEWMRENDQLKNDIIENWFPLYGDGEVTSGTYKRAGKRKHFKEVDIDEWIALGRIDAALKNDRMLDTSLSIVARSDDVE